MNLLALTEGDARPAARHAEGLGLLVAQRPNDALRELRKAASGSTSGRWWNDVAAAELIIARTHGDEEHLLAALVAVDRALECEPTLPEATYNRALVIEAIGLARPAAKEWRRFLMLEASPAWRDEAHRRLKSLQKESSNASEWQRISTTLTTAPAADVIRTTERFPQQARRMAEGKLLADWATASLSGNEEIAEGSLTAARTISETLQHRSGDTLLRDVVAAIDGAPLWRRERLAAAYLVYQDGRVALKEGKTIEAAKTIARAAALFRNSGSPMAAVAEFYAAMAIRNDNRPAEAAHALERLLRSIDVKTYVSLAAQAAHELSLCYGSEARWSDALAMADVAARRFRSIGENESAADVGIISIGLSSMTGQHAEALRYSLRTFRELSLAGAGQRLAAAVAAAGYAQVRHQRWDVAYALARIENELPATQADALLRSDNLIRLAAIEFHLGRLRRAEQAVASARATAEKLSEGQRATIQGELDAVAAAIVRPRKPADAVSLLTRSIAFHRRAARQFALPELYLERGRAHLALDNAAGAAADYDAGISVLEQQRTHASEAWRRIGVFDDATDLFDDAAMLALERGNVNAAFAYVEAKRARALLDELVTDRKRVPTMQNVDQIRAVLPTGGILVEYVNLGVSMVVFVVGKEGIHVQHLSIGSETLGAETRSLGEALMREDEPLARSLLAALHASLIEPIQARIAGQSTWIIVPDPLIQRVPFAALIDRNGEYVVHRHTVLLPPSAATFVASVRRISRASRLPPRAATFGNPTLPLPASFQNLPQAEQEARIVARTYAKAMSTVRKGASQDAFVAALRSAGVIHYGGHATHSTIEPWQSALWLSSGPFTARDIVQTKGVQARVVVLAACSTSGGSDTVIEGSPVLAHAFLLAGVPTVIGTLWDIEDGQATALMRTLHAKLASGTPPATALRDAQLAMLSDTRAQNRNPSRWASFVTIGSQ